MEVTYSNGPRILEDGTNLDLDVLASFPEVLSELEISEGVTGLTGTGYEPGQFNRDQSDL